MSLVVHYYTLLPQIHRHYESVDVQLNSIYFGVKTLQKLRVALLTIGKSISRFLSITKDIDDKSLVQHFMGLARLARLCRP